jgi:hypothetical protein
LDEQKEVIESYSKLLGEVNHEKRMMRKGRKEVNDEDVIY